MRRWLRSGRPTTVRGVIALRVVGAALTFGVIVLVGTWRRDAAWAVQFGMIFVACWLVFGIPLDLARLHRDR